MQVASKAAGQGHANIVPFKAQNTMTKAIAKVALLILVLAFMTYLCFHS